MAYSPYLLGAAFRGAAERPSEDARCTFYAALLGAGPEFASRAAAVLAAALEFAETEHAAAMSADRCDVSRDPAFRRDHEALLSAARRLLRGN